MTDMDRFTEQNDLKTTKLQKLWRSPEQRYRYLEDFFVLLMEMIGWCGIYMAVLLYTRRTATEDILGMLTVPFLYGFTYALQRIELLVQRNVDTRTNGAKYQEYTGAIVLIMGHLLEIILLYGLLGRSAQMAKDITVLYMLIVLWNMAVSIKWWRIHREHFSYTGKWYLAVEVVFIFLLGTFLENSRFRLLAVILGAVLLILHMWCGYLERLNDYLREQSDASDSTKHMIFDGSSKMVVRVLGVFLLGVLFAIALKDVKMGIPFGRYVQYAVRKVVQMIVALVHFIASLWKVAPENVADQAEEITETAAPAVTDLSQFDHPIVLLLGALPFIILLGFAAKELFLKLFRRQEKITAAQSPKLMIPEEIVEVEEEDSFWTKLKRKVFRTNREKVRHLFRRRIVNSLQDKVRSTDTARQLAHKAEDAGTMSLTALTGLYEEARYSEHEITNEQWKSIRQEKGKG